MLFCQHWGQNAAKPIAHFCLCVRKQARCCKPKFWKQKQDSIVYQHPESGDAIETVVTGGALQTTMESRLGDAHGGADSGL